MSEVIVGFVIFVAKVVREVIRLSLDAVSLACWLGALCAPWRTIQVLQTLGQVDSRSKFEWIGIGHIGIVIMDIIVLPFGLVGLAALWRGIPTIIYLVNDRDRSESDLQCNFTIRGALFANFFFVIYDLFALPAGFLVLLSGIRTMKLIEELKKAKRNADHDEFCRYNVDYRNVCLQEFFKLLIDIWFVPLYLVVLLTGYRACAMQADMKKEKGVAQRLQCIYHFFAILFDIPVFILSLFPLLFVYRAGRVIDVFREYPFVAELPPSQSRYSKPNRWDHDQERRGGLLFQFMMQMRDIPLFILAFIITGTLYRLYGLIAKIVVSLKRPKTTNPVMEFRYIKPIFTDRACKLEIEVEKPTADFKVKNMHLHVCGNDFWDHTKGVMGGTAEFARAFLPVNLKNGYVDIKQVNEDKKIVQFAIDFGKIKSSTVRKNIQKLSSAPVMLLQCEDGPTVLFCIPLVLADLQRADQQSAKVVPYKMTANAAPQEKKPPGTHWSCPTCTFWNSNNASTTCEMCGALREISNLQFVEVGAPKPIQLTTIGSTTTATSTTTSTTTTTTSTSTVQVVIAGEKRSSVSSATKPNDDHHDENDNHSHGAEGGEGGAAVSEQPRESLLGKNKHDNDEEKQDEEAQPQGAKVSPDTPATSPRAVSPAASPAASLASPAAALGKEDKDKDLEKGSDVEIIPRASPGTLDFLRGTPVDFWDIGFPTAVLAQTAQIVLDLVYLMLVPITLLAPWRFLSLLVLLFEDKKAWAKRVQLKAIEFTEITHGLMTLYLRHMSQANAEVLKNETRRTYYGERWRWWWWGDTPYRRFEDRCTKGELYKRYCAEYLSMTKFILKMTAAYNADCPVPEVKQYLGTENTRLYTAVMRFNVDCAYACNRLDRLSRQVMQGRVTQLALEQEDQVKAARALMHERAQAIQQELKHLKCCHPLSPLKRGISECRTMVQSSAISAVADVVGIFGALIILISHRSLDFCRDIQYATTWHWRRSIIFKTLRELGLDYAHLLLFILTSALLLYTVPMWMEVSEQVVGERSAYRARKAVRHYFAETAEDWWRYLSIFTLWNSYKFTMAVVVWGVLVPVEMINLMLKSAFPSSPKRLRVFISVILCLYIFASPFVLVYVFGKQGFDQTTQMMTKVGLKHLQAYLGAYLGVLFLTAIGSWILSMRHKEMYELPLQVSKEEDDEDQGVRGEARQSVASLEFTWPNLRAVGQICVECLQLCAMVVLVLTPGANHQVMWWLQELGSILLLMEKSVFLPLFWFAIALAALWYLLISLPTVVEEIMKWSDSGSIMKSKSWGTVGGLLSTTMYVAIIINLLKPLACSESTNTVAGITCWGTKHHQTITVTALVFLSSYILTSHVMSAECGLSQQSHPQLSIRFPQVFLVGVRVLLVTMAGIFVLVGSEFPMVVLGFVIAISLLLAIWTAAFSKLFQSPLSTAPFIIPFRVGAYLTPIAAAIIGMLNIKNVIESEVTAYILLGVVPGLLLISVLASYFRLRAHRYQELTIQSTNPIREEIVSTLLRLEKDAFQHHLMSDVWTEQASKAWRRRVEREVGVRHLAMATLELEQKMIFGVLDGGTYTTLREWRNKISPTWELRHETLRDAIGELSASVGLCMVDLRSIVPKALVETVELFLVTDQVPESVKSSSELRSFFLEARNQTARVIDPMKPIIERLKKLLTDNRIVLEQTIDMPKVLVDLIAQYDDAPTKALNYYTLATWQYGSWW